MISISDVSDERDFSDYPENTEFIHSEQFPRYLLNPFEIIFPSNPRYADALTREELTAKQSKTV